MPTIHHIKTSQKPLPAFNLVEPERDYDPTCTNLPDETDRAQHQETMIRDIILTEIRWKAAQAIEYSKTCLWCGEPTKGGARWCNSDCRDDWQRSAAARIRNG